MTVAELGTRMSSRELDHWKALYQVEHDEQEAAREAAERG